jgi:AcrR family transcriptional regulator
MPDRPLRADAARNRARILDAAREGIAAHGPEVSMDEIALAADVAVGTLYRHFPTKVDLVAAVSQNHMAAVADDVERSLDRIAAGSSTAGDEVEGLMLRFVESSARNRVVKEAARGLGMDFHRTDGPQTARVTVALTQLLDLGHADGSVRDGVTVQDVYLLLMSMPTEQTASARKRWAELVLPGILVD